MSDAEARWEGEAQGNSSQGVVKMVGVGPPIACRMGLSRVLVAFVPCISGSMAPIRYSLKSSACLETLLVLVVLVAQSCCQDALMAAVYSLRWSEGWTRGSRYYSAEPLGCSACAIVAGMRMIAARRGSGGAGPRSQAVVRNHAFGVGFSEGSSSPGKGTLTCRCFRKAK